MLRSERRMSAAMSLRDVGLPARIVEAVGKATRGVVGQEQALDRRAPVERVVALAQPLQDVLRIGRLGGEARVLEAIHAVLQADADLRPRGGRGRPRVLPPLCAVVTTAPTSSSVIWSWSISLMKSTPASTSFWTLARASSEPSTPQRTNFSYSKYGFFWMKGPETYRRGPGISPFSMRFLTSRMSSRGAPRSRDGGDPAHQQLLGRDGHDLVAEAAHVGRVPVLVVGVAQDHQVHVHVHEPGKDAHACGVHHGRAGRDRDLRARADGHDALAGDENHAVVDGRPLVAVDDLAADESQGGFLGGVSRGGRAGQRDQDG